MTLVICDVEVRVNVCCYFRLRSDISGSSVAVFARSRRVNIDACRLKIEFIQNARDERDWMQMTRDGKSLKFDMTAMSFRIDITKFKIHVK